TVPQSKAKLRTIVSKTGCTSVGELEIRRNISAVAACRSSASFNSRVSRATLVSWSPSGELPRVTGGVRRFDTSVLRRRALGSLPLGFERCRMAYPKAQDYADFQSGITAGICDGRNGVYDQFALHKSRTAHVCFGQKRTLQRIG